MFRRPSLLALLVLVLASGVGTAVNGQCVNTSALRTRFAEAPAPSLGPNVAYSLGSNRYFADSDFDFGGYACPNQNNSPAVSYSENTSFNLFGFMCSYGVRTLASAGGWAFILVDCSTPTASVTLASSVGASGIAAILPAVSSRTEMYTAGTMQIGFATLTIRPAVTFRADPMMQMQAVGRSRSANLVVAAGMETTLAYSQSVFSFGIPVQATLSGKAQDVFVNGFTQATCSATAAAVRGNYSLRDDGSNLSFRVTFGGFPITNINWSRAAGSLPAVMF